MTVMGKGRRPRTVGLDAQTVKSLDRYVRGARARHHKAHLPWLWLAPQRRLSDNGLYQMVRRRAKLAGLAHVHPHEFRHGFADQWLRQGGTEGSLMENAGWRNPAMLKRYGASLREDRAIAERRRLSLFENQGQGGTCPLNQLEGCTTVRLPHNPVASAMRAEYGEGQVESAGLAGGHPAKGVINLADVLRRSVLVVIVVLAAVIVGVALFLFLIHPHSGSGSVNMTVSTSP